MVLPRPVDPNGRINFLNSIPIQTGNKSIRNSNHGIHMPFYHIRICTYRNGTISGAKTNEEELVSLLLRWYSSCSPVAAECKVDESVYRFPMAV